MKHRHWLDEMEKSPEAQSPVKFEPLELTVETVYNHVFFYSDVNPDRTLALMKQIYMADAMLRSEQISRWMEDSPIPIWLHVQSPGGGLFAGLAVADQLSKIRSPVYSVVEGYCASAATLISCACTRRYILPDAFMLIHQLSSFMWGKYEEFKDEMKLLDMAMDRLIRLYVSRTKMNADRVRGLLQRDSWFDAKECLELGLVDEIIE